MITDAAAWSDLFLAMKMSFVVKKFNCDSWIGLSMRILQVGVKRIHLINLDFHFTSVLHSYNFSDFCRAVAIFRKYNQSRFSRDTAYE